MSPELLPWQRRFPISYYEQIHRVMGWPYDASSTARTAYIGKLTNKLIYEKLPPGVLQRLKHKNPTDPVTKRRKHKHHQLLTNDVGNPHLQNQITAVILVTDVLNEYLQQRELKVAAPERIAYAVLALTDFFEGNSVADVTPQTCGRYVERRGRSAGTLRRELGVLRAAINNAFRNGRIIRPVAVELPEQPEPRDRWLLRKEAARLIRAARTPQARLYMPLFILIGLYTGRRKEAILSLRWPQVNLHACTMSFEVSGRRRTNKKRGIIPIPPRLLPHLQRARKRGTDLGYVLHIDGERIGDIKKGFAAACGRAGIAHTSPHTLKHTAATWLMQAGTDPWQAAGFLSTSVETLLRIYGHHHPDYQREAAENIGKRPQNVRVTA